MRRHGPSAQRVLRAPSGAVAAVTVPSPGQRASTEAAAYRRQQEEWRARRPDGHVVRLLGPSAAERSADAPVAPQRPPPTDAMHEWVEEARPRTRAERTQLQFNLAA